MNHSYSFRKTGVWVVCLLLLTQTLTRNPAWAEPPAVTASDSLRTASYDALPVKPYVWSNSQKLALAETLSNWAVETLKRENARVGVLARQGSVFTRLFDPTGMTHSGFVFQEPETGEWIIYSLYSDPVNNRKTALLWRQSIKDFFYGQRNDRKEALLLLPSDDLQERLLQRLRAKPFQSLLPLQHHYNLVAPLESVLSFNCTKWVVLNLFAARENSEDVPALIGRMRQEYTVKPLRPRFLVRLVLKRKPDVNWEELNPPGTVKTVTVESLYNTPLFEKRFLFSDSQD
ncbi:DUF2145 domain-containing protein [Vampirovibrio chlorellavorus]|uniref:DUF2145 domain-containing protein n=1 Tax=Vampirovibrio chlorellavorus TaxID=758823 RepID=UPI0026F3205C|nr:DUF2145 domain-containing protein [Vampirovibrio chlorellavorus]